MEYGVGRNGCGSSRVVVHHHKRSSVDGGAGSVGGLRSPQCARGRRGGPGARNTGVEVHGVRHGSRRQGREGRVCRNHRSHARFADFPIKEVVCAGSAVGACCGCELYRVYLAQSSQVVGVGVACGQGRRAIHNARSSCQLLNVDQITAGGKCQSHRNFDVRGSGSAVHCADRRRCVQKSPSVQSCENLSFPLVNTNPEVNGSAVGGREYANGGGVPCERSSNGQTSEIGEVCRGRRGVAHRGRCRKQSSRRAAGNASFGVVVGDQTTGNGRVGRDGWRCVRSACSNGRAIGGYPHHGVVGVAPRCGKGYRGWAARRLVADGGRSRERAARNKAGRGDKLAINIVSRRCWRKGSHRGLGEDGVAC